MLRAAPTGCSIGEAEDYRFYWNPSWDSDPPAWLGPENPDWEGNYKVRFWYPEWQEIMFVYIDTIQGIGVEDVFFPGDLDENNPWNPDYERINMLDVYLGSGIPVFSVEYLTDAGKIQQYITAARTEGYIPYVTIRELDTLFDGISVSVKAEEDPDAASYRLLQNYPNPFNGFTRIICSVGQAGPVRLILYNANGQWVRTLMDEVMGPGSFSVEWDGTDQNSIPVSTGIYLATFIREGKALSTRRMILLQ